MDDLTSILAEELELPKVLPKGNKNINSKKTKMITKA
jgi:hypothetical protein